MGTYTDFKYLRQISSTLRNFREVEQFKANFSCPLCGDSKKIKWKARGYVYVYRGKSFFKCQNCGEAKSFGSFLRVVDENTWREWRKESLREEPDYKIQPITPQLVSVKKSKYDHMVCVTELPEDHIARVYVQSRGIPKIRYSLLFYTENFRTLVEEVFPGKGGRYPEDERLVLPIYNQKGELIAISGRDIHGSKIRYATAKSDDQKCFFGLERMKSDKPVLVVEGQIDSLFLPNSVAVCHADLGMFPRFFPSLNSFLVFDNEPLNPEIVKYMEKAIEEERTICVWLDCPFKGKDINAMIQNGASIRRIVQFILRNSFKGQQAKFKLIKWKNAA